MPRRGSRVRISSSAPFFSAEYFDITTSTLTKLAPTEVELEIPISQEEISAAEDRAFKRLARSAKVPGFRPGKIPRKVFEQNYGTESVRTQAMEDLVPEAYSRAVREHAIEPVARPQMELMPDEAGMPLRVKAKVTIRPHIDLKDYKGIAVESDAVVVTEEDIERSLTALARDRATLVPVERAAAVGDYVVVDFEGKIDGVPFEGGTAENQTTELSEERFIPGFASGIAGMNAGETRDVTATFPQDYTQADLAGKDAVFTVKLHEVKELELPVMDDEFAKTVSKNTSLSELREDVSKRLEAIARDKSRKEMGNSVMDALLGSHEFPLPDVMVDQEVQNMLSDAHGFATRMGVSFEDYLKATNKQADGLEAEFRPDAEKRVKGTLLIEAIAKAENINATPADVQAELASLAQQYGQPIERIKQALGNNVLSLMDGIVRSKTMDWLIEHAQIKEATQSPKK
ncbi:MAG: trigger factor [Candidatus Eremiobacteraeota bacterium]|nr:trigger factor [Candidatus Eremiobacteraeota bacterium]